MLGAVTMKSVSARPQCKEEYGQRGQKHIVTSKGEIKRHFSGFFGIFQTHTNDLKGKDFGRLFLSGLLTVAVDP